VNNEGDRTTYEYDPAGRVLKTVNQTTGLTDALTRNDAGLPVSQLITWGPRLLYLFEHDYDLSGDMVKKVGWGAGTAWGAGVAPSKSGLGSSVDDGTGVGADCGVTRYAYDGMDRLTHVEYPDGRVVEYEFDDLGNRAKMVEIVGVPGAGDASPGGSDGSGGASTGQSVSQTIYTYDAGSRLLAAETVSGGNSRTVLHFGYDRNGNQVAKEDLIYAGGSAIGADSWSFGFDGLNRLDGVVTPEAGRYRYTYAGDGLRVGKRGPEQMMSYLWDGQNLVLAADALNGRAAAVVRGRKAISALTGQGVEYLVTDLHGDVRAVMDAGANPVGQYSYDAFGGLAQGSMSADVDGPDCSLVAYAGDQLDQETTYYYLRARFYDPDLGRFVSQDFWPAEPMMGSTGYAYCSANSIRFADPSGHVQTVLGDMDLEQEKVLFPYDGPPTVSSDVLTGVVIKLGGSIEVKARVGVSGEIMIVLGADSGVYLTGSTLVNTQGGSINFDVGALFNSENPQSVAGTGHGVNVTAPLPKFIRIPLGLNAGTDISSQPDSRGQQVYIAYVGVNFPNSELTVGGSPRSYTIQIVLTQKPDSMTFPGYSSLSRGG